MFSPNDIMETIIANRTRKSLIGSLEKHENDLEKNYKQQHVLTQNMGIKGKLCELCASIDKNNTHNPYQHPLKKR